MELSDAIKTRRSIRKFDPAKDVTNDQIRKILEAGILAPSSGNTQCWRFIVIRDKKTRSRLSTDAGHQSFIKEVPVVVIVCADLNASAAYGSRGIETYSLQDTAAAIQNMLLTITEMGLAACWVGAFNEDGASQVLGLPKDLRPLAMLPIGYPAESPKMPRRKSIEEVTDWR